MLLPATRAYVAALFLLSLIALGISTYALWALDHERARVNHLTQIIEGTPAKPGHAAKPGLISKLKIAQVTAPVTLPPFVLKAASRGVLVTRAPTRPTGARPVTRIPTSHPRTPPRTPAPPTSTTTTSGPSTPAAPAIPSITTPTIRLPPLPLPRLPLAPLTGPIVGSVCSTTHLPLLCQ